MPALDGFDKSLRNALFTLTLSSAVPSINLTSIKRINSREKTRLKFLGNAENQTLGRSIGLQTGPQKIYRLELGYISGEKIAYDLPDKIISLMVMLNSNNL